MKLRQIFLIIAIGKRQISWENVLRFFFALIFRAKLNRERWILNLRPNLDVWQKIFLEHLIEIFQLFPLSMF
jgi:hypothetical protein